MIGLSNINVFSLELNNISHITKMHIFLEDSGVTRGLGTGGTCVLGEQEQAALPWPKYLGTGLGRPSLCHE